MPLDVKAHLAHLLRDALAQLAPEAIGEEIVIERPRKPEHGDFACNVALQLAKRLKRPPRQLAEGLASALRALPGAGDTLHSVEVAGAGFVNLRLAPGAKLAQLKRVLAEGTNYGRRATMRPSAVQVEFVSANPTGPLHVGHGRGAAYGASLANILEFAGHAVTREYYINDAGRQMDILALSTWLRYLEAQRIEAPFPEGAYRGAYVRDMAAELAKRHGARFVRGAQELAQGLPFGDPDSETLLDAYIERTKTLLGADYAILHAHALESQMADLRADLSEFGVRFDMWYSERSLYEHGLVTRAVERLAAAGHLYEKDGAQWFRSSAFGDEKDRVVRRENGQYTYFASDIAYHLDKYERGFDRLIDVWGADHHGYIARVKGALGALGQPPERLTVALVQFAVLYRGGEKVSMSTRAGEFVTLRELRAEVGNDAARFFYVLRKSDQHLDFDLDLAKAQSNDNPVYYVQYAHARVCSVFAQCGDALANITQAKLDTLTLERELALAQRLADFPDVVQAAARELAPHSVAFYLRDVAGEFHSYYNAERILVEDATLRMARLALCAAVRQTLANGLALLGVSAPEKM